MPKTTNFTYGVTWLAHIAKNIVKKYGAPYYTFAIVGLINFPIAIIYEIYAKSYLTGIILRIISFILCLVLLFHKQWPYKLKLYLPLYWFIVIIFTLPFLTTYLLLKNNFSLEWLINFNIGVMIVILLLDSITFLSVETIGIILGVIFFYTLGNKIDSWPTGYQTYLFFYMFLCITILGTIFSKNKEVFNYFKQKNQEELNDYLELEIKSRTIELEQALAAKTEFLNNMSHEIRTPVQGFDGISKGLVENWNNLEENMRFTYVEHIAKNSSRLLSLLGHLLDLSKFVAGKITLDFEKIELNQAIEEMIEEAKTLYIIDKQISINFTPAENSLILADKERITQVLRNLFVNAIKFSPHKGTINVFLKNSEITYDDHSKSDAYHFVIEDQGIGIPENELESIFTPFFQSSRTKTRAGGTGLGLAIASEIIEKLHGKIWAANNLEQGATFNFIIPISQYKYMDGHKIIADNDREVTQPMTRIANILVVDDEETCLMSIELLLFGSGYNLYKFHEGYAGLEYLKSNYNLIDLIILDLMLPDIYGLNLITEIKKDPMLAKIPIILQTGSSDIAEIEKAFELGINSYIKKPYQKHTVMHEIAKNLNKNYK